jgi:hypothetical protein
MFKTVGEPKVKISLTFREPVPFSNLCNPCGLILVQYRYIPKNSKRNFFNSALCVSAVQSCRIFSTVNSDSKSNQHIYFISFYIWMLTPLHTHITKSGLLIMIFSQIFLNNSYKRFLACSRMFSSDLENPICRNIKCYLYQIHRIVTALF